MGGNEEANQGPLSPEQFQANFLLTVFPQEGITTFIVEGELDMLSAPILLEEVTTFIDTSTAGDELAVDFRKITFIDGAGLNAMINAHSRCTDAGLQFFIQNPSLLARRFFDLTSMDKYFNFVFGSRRANSS